jgi:hypothetical protein
MDGAPFSKLEDDASAVGSAPGNFIPATDAQISTISSGERLRAV